MNCHFIYPRKIEGRLYTKGKHLVPDEDIKKASKFFEALIACGDVMEIPVPAGTKLKTPAKELNGSALIAEAARALAEKEAKASKQ